MAVKITIFQTGTIRVPQSQMSPLPGNIWLRRLRFLSDRNMTEPIPIYAFLIEHPEGNFLFDLGESPRAIEPGYFSWWQIGHHRTSLSIESDQGLAEQLRARGINPKADIKGVILSHLHSDHAGALEDVHEGSPLFTTKAHWEAFGNYFHATIEGANPAAWPPGFQPSFLKADGPAIGPWTCSYKITSDGKILAVDTPGHVPGHVSLIVIDNDVTYLLVGDAAYSLECLDKEQVDGITTTPEVALESQRKIKEFCRTQRVVILTSHEFDSVRRLKEKDAYRPAA